MFGIPDKAWAAALDEATGIVAEAARAKSFLTYSDLAVRLTTIQVEAHDPRMAALLDAISEREDEAGRGMLSALVVQKDTMHPGNGFFQLAKTRGKNVSDREAFWMTEVRRVHAAWS